MGWAGQQDGRRGGGEERVKHSCGLNPNLCHLLQRLAPPELGKVCAGGECKRLCQGLHLHPSLAQLRSPLWHLAAWPRARVKSPS